MAVWSQHSGERRLGSRKWTHAGHRKGSAIGIAMIVTLSYLTVLLSCAHPEGKYLGSFVVQSFAHARVTSETPDRGTDEELCKAVHKQVVALQHFSIGSILGVKTPHLDIAIGEEVPSLTAILNSFRPPDNGFAPAKVVTFQLSSVLRI